MKRKKGETFFHDCGGVFFFLFYFFFNLHMHTTTLEGVIYEGGCRERTREK